MKFVPILIGLITCIVLGQFRPDSTLAENHQTSPLIVLFGARWCAPCQDELIELPTLAEAASPDRILLAWIDRAVDLPETLAGKVDTISPLASQDLARQALRPGYGLPTAIMFDSKGKICARFEGKVDVFRIRQLRKECGQAVHQTSDSSDR